MKRTFKPEVIFNHVDPHMARFVVQPTDGIVGLGPAMNLLPNFFPADFELAEYDVKASMEIVVEVKRKKKK